MDILKRHKAVVLSIITFLEVVLSIYNYGKLYVEEKGIVIAMLTGILFAACECFQFYSIVEIAERPVFGVIMLVFSQIFTFAYEIITGATTTEAMNDMGITGLIIVIAMLIHMIITNKNVNEKTKNKEKVGKRFKNIIYYKRNLINVSWYTRVIVYSLAITTVMSLANSEVVTTLNNTSTFRLYAALVLAVPTFMVFGILTTSYFAYEMMLFKILLECYTIYLLSTVVKGVDIVQIGYIIVEVIVITYSYMIAVSNKKIEKENEKNKSKVHKKLRQHNKKKKK
jgi:hypothetical protein